MTSGLLPPMNIRLVVSRELLNRIMERSIFSWTIFLTAHIPEFQHGKKTAPKYSLLGRGEIRTLASVIIPILPSEPKIN